MIICNITFHIENVILDEYLEFLKKEYIPLVMAEGLFENPRLCKVMTQSDDESGSYAFQFEAKNTRLLDEWWQRNSARLNESIVERFADKAIGFTTLLESVNLEEE